MMERLAISLERVWLWLATGRVGVPGVLAVAVFAAVFPLVLIRGYHWEEGLTVALANDLLAGGSVFEPKLFGYVWLERPFLLSWLIALVSWPFGFATPLLARLPTVLGLLAMVLLVERLVRSHTSREAALFGGAALLFCPMVLNRAVTAEPDVALSAVQFCAFVVWWEGRGTGGFRIRRWLAVGGLLGVTALFKGPQPAAFFATGVGAFLLLRREWRELPGYALAGVVSLGIVGGWYAGAWQPGAAEYWIGYMRLGADSDGTYLVEKLRLIPKLLLSLLPAVLIAGCGWFLARRSRTAAPRELVLALSLYASIGTLAVVLWPDGTSRYAAPAAPAVAALAALMFDAVRQRARGAFALALLVLAGLVANQLVRGWILAPLLPEKFAAARVAATTVQQTTAARPAIIYAPARSADMVLAYLRQPIRYLPPDELFSSVQAPAWIILEPAEAEALSRHRPDVQVVNRSTIHHPRQLHVLELLPR